MHLVQLEYLRVTQRQWCHDDVTDTHSRQHSVGFYIKPLRFQRVRKVFWTFIECRNMQFSFHRPILIIFQNVASLKPTGAFKMCGLATKVFSYRCIWVTGRKRGEELHTPAFMLQWIATVCWSIRHWHPNLSLYICNHIDGRTELRSVALCTALKRYWLNKDTTKW